MRQGALSKYLSSMAKMIDQHHLNQDVKNSETAAFCKVKRNAWDANTLALTLNPGVVKEVEMEAEFETIAERGSCCYPLRISKLSFSLIIKMLYCLYAEMSCPCICLRSTPIRV